MEKSSNGHVLVWDVTCVDTFSCFYATMVSDGPGCIANTAEGLKKGKYVSIEATHHLCILVLRLLAYLDLWLTFLHELVVRPKMSPEIFVPTISCYNELQLSFTLGMLQLCLDQAQSVMILLNIYIYIYYCNYCCCYYYYLFYYYY